MQAAKSTAARLLVTLTLRQGRCTCRKMNRLAVPLRLYSQFVALGLTRRGRDRLPDLADELGRAFVKANDWALRIGRLRIEVEHILHAGDVFAIDLRNAPHVLAPRLEVVFGQTPAHRLARDAVVLGEPDQFVRQQLQGPTGAALGWARTGGRDQQGFLFARELAARSRTRLFTERGLQVADDKAALGPVHGRAAHADAGRDLLVTGARVGSQQNLRALELTRRMFAPAQKRRECAALANEQGSSSDSRALP